MRSIQERLERLEARDAIVHDLGSASSRITFQCMMTSTGAFPKPGLVTGVYNTQYTREGSTWLVAARRERQVFSLESAYYGVTAAEADLASTESISR